MIDLAQVSPLEILCTFLFAIAIIHTFSVKKLHAIGSRFREGSVAENVFHLLGEVEVVFGLWAGIFVAVFAASLGVADAIQYLEARNFTEPAFVFVIMAICSTKPILDFAEKLIGGASRILPLPKPVAFYFTAMTLGPILGSFITEPAAMTVTAFLLLEKFYKQTMSQKLMYASLGLLFVNISIGGVLTPYAAPPVLMVASTWGWDLSFMINNFGWKAIIAVLLNAGLITMIFYKELKELKWVPPSKDSQPIPFWLIALHLVFLVVVVLGAHHMVVFMGVFLFFLGLVTATQEYQSPLRLKESLLVAFFLGGLVVLGGLQRWWLEPLLTQLDALPLFLGSTALTAVTDNAALTYLGSQVPGLSDFSKYALVAGAVTGGGLTVIANAPNPAGYGILNPSFKPDGISPVGLLKGAIVPTLIAAACFWLL